MGDGKIDKSLLSGSTTLLLLQLLSEKDMYGYEMIETLRDRGSSGVENCEKKLRQQYPSINWKPGKLLNGAPTKEALAAWVNTLE